MGKAKDFTGQTFNYLTFIRPTDQRAYGSNIIWELLCVCGNTTFASSHKVATGRFKSCGCKRKEAFSKVGSSSRQYEPRISSARAVWQRTYQDDGLDFDTFYQLSQLPCDYCGIPPSQTFNAGLKKTRLYASEHQLELGAFTYNGLDRIDSSKGHTPDNLVPCCWTCNRMKGNMTREEFIAHIHRTSAHLSVRKQLRGVPSEELATDAA